MRTYTDQVKYAFIILFLCTWSPAFAEASQSTVYTAGAWSPYVVGALIGVLSWCTFFFAGKKIGVSSFYASVSGLIGKAVAPQHTMGLAYFKEKPPAVNWEFVFALSIFVGAAIAAITGGEFGLRGIPPMWTQHYGTDHNVLYGVLGFTGGILAALGSRIAGGCTSGHGISGTLQLSVSSWITVICMFVGGVVVARLIY